MDDDPTQLEIHLEIDTVSHQWKAHLQNLINQFKFWTVITFNHLKISGNFEISVVLGNDAYIRSLNATYRGKDKATNVLSFPSTYFGKSQNQLDKFSVPLGDIVISYETVTTEAQEQHKSFFKHICHLWIHSVLHLIGYDHSTDAQATIMENIEITILKFLNINNPYEIVEGLSHAE